MCRELSVASFSWKEPLQLESPVYLPAYGLVSSRGYDDDGADDDDEGGGGGGWGWGWVTARVREGVRGVPGEKGGLHSCIQEEAENLPDATAMPEVAEYRREQRLERERGGAGGGGGSCPAERSGGARTLAWGGRGPREEGAGRREEKQRDSQKVKRGERER